MADRIPIPAAPVRNIVLEAFRSRMSGPGGYYNLGNLINLVCLALGAGIVGSGIVTYLAGSASALALTVATLIFLCGGEVYHRAWQNGAPPDAALNRRADLLSGVGGVALGAALLMLGQPVLAAFSGGLHALGKFGSAWHRDQPLTFLPWDNRWPDPFRLAVLVARVPAILAALVALWVGLEGPGSGKLADAVPTLGLLASFLLWARADLMLLRTGSADQH